MYLMAVNQGSPACLATHLISVKFAGKLSDERFLLRCGQDWVCLVQVGRSLREGSSAQAADLVSLRSSCLEQQRLMGAHLSALHQQVARLETQLRTEQRTQDLLESQAVLIAELRYDSSL